MRTTPILLLLSFAALAQKGIDPTFLRADLPAAPERKADITTGSCHYKPLFGDGASNASLPAGVVRYGEATVDPAGSCAVVRYSNEEQVYVVLDGAGTVRYASGNAPLRKEDFLYLPATVPHSLENPAREPLRVLIMGFRSLSAPKALAALPDVANIEDVPLQMVGGHPSSTRYRLLMGDVESKRDRIRAAHTLTSLFLMEIAPGGTNQPHHHEREEEIYLVLEGRGEIAAGSGLDGIEGRFAAQAGTAYFFRLNCTVGFYSAPGVRSRVLAVRSWYPGMELKGMEH
ncbi:MAG TPA: cupin domain-containing protein [Bryobacteraceae bacterium]|jgi:mannose-6-phosphate isomerase-like protein (cupin superfamily)|nr:cupin domain-containing protein [Bryobacteraceae bacterium]